MNDLRKEFNAELRKAKTPDQVFRVYTKYSDTLMSRYCTSLLCSYEGYVNTVGKILKSDKHRQVRTKKGHRSDRLTKTSALQLMNAIEKYGDKLFDQVKCDWL